MKMKKIGLFIVALLASALVYSQVYISRLAQVVSGDVEKNVRVDMKIVVDLKDSVLSLTNKETGSIQVIMLLEKSSIVLEDASERTWGYAKVKSSSPYLVAVSFSESVVANEVVSINLYMKSGTIMVFFVKKEEPLNGTK